MSDDVPGWAAEVNRMAWALEAQIVVPERHTRVVAHPLRDAVTTAGAAAGVLGLAVWLGHHRS